MPAHSPRRSNGRPIARRSWPESPVVSFTIAGRIYRRTSRSVERSKPRDLTKPSLVSVEGIPMRLGVCFEARRHFRIIVHHILGFERIGFQVEQGPADPTPGRFATGTIVPRFHHMTVGMGQMQFPPSVRAQNRFEASSVLEPIILVRVRCLLAAPQYRPDIFAVNRMIR